MTWLAPVAVAALVMLPRLASPQFGLLDDGLTLQTGREVVGRWWNTLYLIPETGRFFPAYWLAHSAIFGIVGVRPLAFFTVNVVILAALLGILARLVRLTGGTPLQAAVAMVVFAMGGPTIESFYTLSKAEPLQVLWIGVSLLATKTAVAVGAPRARRVALIGLAAAALLCAHTTKETSVVLVPISVGWLAVDRWASRERLRSRGFAATYAAINVVAALAFVVLRSHYAPLGLGEGTYTRAYALDLQVVGPSVFRVCAWLLRDFAFLLPMLVFSIGWRPGGRAPSGRVLRYAGVWMVGWLAVFLPWPATFEYYLLPFALGAAALTGLVVGDCWAARAPSHPLTGRRVAWSVLVTSGVLWLVTGMNAAADARVQLTVDRANADLVDFLGGLPSGSRVVLNTAVNEYHAELPMHLSEIKRRSDITVEDVSRLPRDGRSADVFVVTAELANRPWPTVRVALDEPGVGRDQATLNQLLTGPSEPVYRAVQQARLAEVGLHRLLCRVAVRPFIDPGFCPNDRSVFDRRLFSYGWQVHRLMRSTSGREATRHDG